jgi:hypothetical protein
MAVTGADDAGKAVAVQSTVASPVTNGSLTTLASGQDYACGSSNAFPQQVLSNRSRKYIRPAVTVIPRPPLGVYIADEWSVR